jgi:glycosyltransferase involved in cell wall biosynthesis
MPSPHDLKTILYLSTSSGPGGAERVISNLAASLDPERYRAILCLFRPGWIQERSEDRGIRTFIIPTHGMTDWRWALQFKRLLRQEQVDLIHAHEFDANVQGNFCRSDVRNSSCGNRSWEKLFLGKIQASSGLSVGQPQGNYGGCI